MIIDNIKNNHIPLINHIYEYYVFHLIYTASCYTNTFDTEKIEILNIWESHFYELIIINTTNMGNGNSSGGNSSGGSSKSPRGGR